MRADFKWLCGSATSGLSSLIKDHLAGGASRLAALLLPQILPVFSVVAPCHPGAALRDLVLVQRGRATRRFREGPQSAERQHERKELTFHHTSRGVRFMHVPPESSDANPT